MVIVDKQKADVSVLFISEYNKQILFVIIAIYLVFENRKIDGRCAVYMNAYSS